MLEDATNDLSNGFRESLTARYNKLRHEALKYVDEGMQTEETYNVAMDALREAANKVSMARKTARTSSFSNGTRKQDHSTPDHDENNINGDHPLNSDEQDKQIQKLTRQLKRAQRKCEAYQANLFSVLKDIEQQKLQLSVKVQNIKLGMKC